jgi:hypothetical protein
MRTEEAMQMNPAPPTTPVSDSVSKVNDEIAVGEDLNFQRSWWRFERGVWLVFVAILILDLLGAFGRGYLANSRMQAADGTLAICYEHIERYSTPSIMQIHFGPTAIHDGKIQLYVSQSVLDDLGNRRIIPQPASSMVQQSGVLYTFPASSAGSAAFALQPTRPGIFHVTLQVPGGEALRTRIFVFP